MNFFKKSGRLTVNRIYIEKNQVILAGIDLFLKFNSIRFTSQDTALLQGGDHGGGGFRGCIEDQYGIHVVNFTQVLRISIL